MPRFRVNEPNVVFEAFDEEIVLVNLETGNYYSVRGSGPAVWMALSKGVAVDTLAAAIGAATGATGQTTDDLARFAEQLVAAELLVAEEGEGTVPGDWTDDFVPPVLEVYSDMQDLLMLDPIHDVDGAGWPMAKDG